MYVEIFENIESKLDDNHWFRLSEAITNIFKNSIQCNTNLFRVLLGLVIVSQFKIILDPYLLTDCCLSSGLLSTGTLIIEGYIRNMDGVPQTKKSKGLDSSQESIYWIKLAELYMEMKEWDVVCSIFEEKVSCVDQTLKKAIISEKGKFWAECEGFYELLIKNNLTVATRDFYYEAYFRCLANLGQWQKLAETIKAMETPNQDYWDALWNEDWKQKKLLPWLMTAEVADMLYKQRPSKVFFENVNRSLCDPQKAQILKNDFPEHLAIMWAVTDDLESAESYLESYWDTFLSQWQVLDPMFSSMRLDKIMKLRDCVSIYEFVDISRKLYCIDSNNVYKWIRMMWSNMHGEMPHSLVWHERSLLYNKQFASLIQSKLISFGEPELQLYVDELKKINRRMDFDLIDSALNEGNFYMARKYYIAHKEEIGMEYYIAKLNVIKSSSYRDQPEKMLIEWFKSLARIINVRMDSNNVVDNKMLLSSLLTAFDIFEQVYYCVDKRLDLLREHTATISQLIGRNVSKSEDIIDYNVERLFSFLGSEGGALVGRTEPETIAAAYLKLANIMPKTNLNTEFYNMFLLRAMRMGSREAIHSFPSIMRQDNLGNSDTFITECESVPTWMFLRWIPQLLAKFNSGEIKCIGSILKKIAEAYPQAIVYSYIFFREKLLANFPNSDVIQKLDNCVINEEKNMLMLFKCLAHVVVPHLLLLYQINRILKHAMAEERNHVMAVCVFVCSDLFECDPDSTDPEKLQGNVFKKMLDHTKVFKKLWLNEKKDLIEIMENLKVKLQEEERNRKYSTLLRDYSPWLANFSSSRFDWDIEIPGQYSGLKKPIIRHHVKLRKFHPRVKVMDSLRKPIKITMLGDDTKEYSYLLKFGEDLRQDERVQQIFVLINEILFNKTDDKRHMALSTFEVIPLSINFGIIKWVDNTQNLREFMGKCIKNKRDVNSFPNGVLNLGPYDRYRSFIHSSTKGKKTDKEAFGKSAQIHDRNKTVACFRSLVNDIEPDLLRKAFWMLSTSIESFVALRHNFMRSYASMCVAHWLLGVGDRHLGNTLICLDNGRVIGIDFGHTFGTATQCLGVPELVPFRLTPQIVTFMEPFKEKGHFRESMIFTLRHLRDTQRLLLDTLTSFIKDPTVDWLDKLKSKNDFNEKDGTENWNWDSASKIDQVNCKLEGMHPAISMVKDLECSQVKEYFEAYRRLVEGVAQYDYRAQIEDNYISVEAQVDCLIDQAGDYNLLGRMFYGWSPWV